MRNKELIEVVLTPQEEARKLKRDRRETVKERDLDRRQKRRDKRVARTW